MCFNACVSQQEGLLRGIREESWNQHRDLENHSGTFLEKLIQPIEAEWGNSHPSVCNTLFFYWAVFPLSLSLSQSLSVSLTHTQEVSPYVLGAEAVQTDDVTDRHVVTCMHRCCNFWNKSEHWKHFVRDVQIVKHYSILPFFYLLKSFIWNTVKPKLFLYWCYALVWNFLIKLKIKNGGWWCSGINCKAPYHAFHSADMIISSVEEAENIK